MTSRPRAVSPFLPSASDLKDLPSGSALAVALASLPDQFEADSTDLAVADDLAIELAGVRTELTAAQQQTAMATFKTLAEKDIIGHAPNSRRSMRADWRHWVAFCVVRDRVAMPISFDDLTDFLDALMDAGYQRATIEHLLFTLRTASKLWDCPSPTDSLPWKDYWRDRCRKKLIKRQAQAAAMNVEELDVINANVDPEDPRSIRDALFAACAYDLLARASELVAMRWDLIRFNVDTDGGANYLIERSKTDQEGQGELRYLTPETVQLLHAWNAHRCQDNAYLFHALPRYKGQPLDLTQPLNVREASRIFARLSAKGDFGKRLSGHSARVGAAQDMTRAGMDLPAIMQAGRWKTPVMPARYAENELAARSGQNRRKAIDKLRK